MFVQMGIGDKFDLGDELGRGSFSVVYKARSKQTKKDVAVKVYGNACHLQYSISAEKRELRNFRKNILTEITILKRIRHPNVIKIHEVCEYESRLYISMELYEE